MRNYLNLWLNSACLFLALLGHIQDFIKIPFVFYFFLSLRNPPPSSSHRQHQCCRVASPSKKSFSFLHGVAAADILAIVPQVRAQEDEYEITKFENFFLLFNFFLVFSLRLRATGPLRHCVIIDKFMFYLSILPLLGLEEDDNSEPEPKSYSSALSRILFSLDEHLKWKFSFFRRFCVLSYFCALLLVAF